MKLFTVTNFPGHYPVGFAAIIVAHNVEEAKTLFEQALVEDGLELTDRFNKPIKYTPVEVNLKVPKAVLLANGNY